MLSTSDLVVGEHGSRLQVAADFGDGEFFMLFLGRFYGM